MNCTIVSACPFLPHECARTLRVSMEFMASAKNRSPVSFNPDSDSLSSFLIQLCSPTLLRPLDQIPLSPACLPFHQVRDHKQQRLHTEPHFIRHSVPSFPLPLPPASLPFRSSSRRPLLLLSLSVRHAISRTPSLAERGHDPRLLLHTTHHFLFRSSD